MQTMLEKSHFKSFCTNIFTFVFLYIFDGENEYFLFMFMYFFIDDIMSVWWKENAHP